MFILITFVARFLTKTGFDDVFRIIQVSRREKPKHRMLDKLKDNKSGDNYFINAACIILALLRKSLES